MDRVIKVYPGIFPLTASICQAHLGKVYPVSALLILQIVVHMDNVSSNNTLYTSYTNLHTIP
jgi:hypothetical protein